MTTTGSPCCRSLPNLHPALTQLAWNCTSVSASRSPSRTHCSLQTHPSHPNSASIPHLASTRDIPVGNLAYLTYLGVFSSLERRVRGSAPRPTVLSVAQGFVPQAPPHRAHRPSQPVARSSEGACQLRRHDYRSWLYRGLAERHSSSKPEPVKHTAAAREQAALFSPAGTEHIGCGIAFSLDRVLAWPNSGKVDGTPTSPWPGADWSPGKIEGIETSSQMFDDLSDWPGRPTPRRLRRRPEAGGAIDHDFPATAARMINREMRFPPSRPEAQPAGGGRRGDDGSSWSRAC